MDNGESGVSRPFRERAYRFDRARSYAITRRDYGWTVIATVGVNYCGQPLCRCCREEAAESMSARSIRTAAARALRVARVRLRSAMQNDADKISAERARIDMQLPFDQVT